MVCFFAGISASGYFFYDILDRTALPVIFVGIFILFFFQVIIAGRRYLYAALCVMVFILGASRYISSVSPLPGDISGFSENISKEITVQGRVLGEPERKDIGYTQAITFVMEAGRMILSGKELRTSGKISVVAADPRYIPFDGDEIVLSGRISLPKGKTNPSGYDHKGYLRHKGIRSVMFTRILDKYSKTGEYGGIFLLLKRQIHKVRRHSEALLDKYVHGLTRGILKAVLLGIRSEVPESVREMLVKTGTVHIIAVSGLHIGIIATVFFALCRLFGVPKRTGCILTVLLMFSFAVFAGGRPSSMRAAMMGGFLMIGLISGRKIDIISSVFLSAFILTFFVPGQLFDLGFILSYTAVLSIIYIAPGLEKMFIKFLHSKKYLYKGRASIYLIKVLSVSTAVWLGMMPILASFNRILSISSLFANLLAVPVLFIMLISGCLLIVSGSLTFLFPCAAGLSRTLEYFVSAFIKAMNAISRCPAAFIGVRAPGAVMMAAIYMLIGALLFFGSKAMKWARLIILLLCLANIFVWQELSARPPGHTCVKFFDSGKSDAVLFEFPDGSVMLMDCGTDVGKNIVGPYLRDKGIRRIDCVIVTHFHEDHCGGMPWIIKNFKVGTVVYGSGQDASSPELKNAIKKRDVKVREAGRGDIIKGLMGLDLLVLNPEKERKYDSKNDSSLVIKAVFDAGNSILLPGDAEKAALEEILQYGEILMSNIVKAPHHGTVPVDDVGLYREVYERTGCTDIIITNKDSEALREHISDISGKDEQHIHVTGQNGAILWDNKTGEIHVF